MRRLRPFTMIRSALSARRRGKPQAFLQESNFEQNAIKVSGTGDWQKSSGNTRCFTGCYFLRTPNLQIYVSSSLEQRTTSKETKLWEILSHLAKLCVLFCELNHSVDPKASKRERVEPEQVVIGVQTHDQEKKTEFEIPSDAVA
ncbi:hypothetical protein CSKR_201675 [Clonorchis sinensis]|uniref:Uncharacterized protein n=1 Tax=Clonorchis sinensis TaxID=79923 RepID=A0A8T1MSR9_CLOSI|nr:hypothetical protein CSKR_201675 [Clonorchis sinensis]